jgi:hypothetical protein
MCITEANIIKNKQMIYATANLANINAKSFHQ